MYWLKVYKDETAKPKDLLWLGDSRGSALAFECRDASCCIGKEVMLISFNLLASVSRPKRCPTIHTHCREQKA